MLTDLAFLDYGVSYTQYDVCELQQSMDVQVPIPAPTLLYRYISLYPAMEKLPVVQQIGRDVLLGRCIEAGEWLGHAEALTAVEFYQGSEVNVSSTDVVMVIGKRGQSYDGVFNAEKDAKLSSVPLGTVVESSSDTCYYSPCEAVLSGFKFIVLLIAGSNVPLPVGYVTDNPLIVKQNKSVVV